MWRRYREVVEDGLVRVPIISSEFLNPISIFDYNHWETYRESNPDIESLYKNIYRLSTDSYKLDFFNALIHLN